MTYCKYNLIPQLQRLPLVTAARLETHVRISMPSVGEEYVAVMVTSVSLATSVVGKVTLNNIIINLTS